MLVFDLEAQPHQRLGHVVVRLLAPFLRSNITFVLEVAKLFRTDAFIDERLAGNLFDG